MISIGIVGASGYTGEELIRLLLKHPEASIDVLTSRTYSGKSVDDVKKALERDYFMTPDTAKEFGLIDDVVENRS